MFNDSVSYIFLISNKIQPIIKKYDRNIPPSMIDVNQTLVEFLKFVTYWKRKVTGKWNWIRDNKGKDSQYVMRNMRVPYHAQTKINGTSALYSI